MQHGASWRMGALAVTLVLAGARAAGAMELLERNGLTLSLEIEAGVGGLLTENTNFGLGRIDLPNGDISGDAQWGEGYVKPGLSMEYGSAAGAFYGGPPASARSRSATAMPAASPMAATKSSVSSLSMAGGARARS